MPFIDLHSKDDFASIFYITNSEFGNVGGFDPEKPTVLILHPIFLDVQWIDNHWGDPRIYRNCNLIAFDMRCSGRSVSRPSARHDNWVEAADIALCHMKLRLPPCHILALESTAILCALRLAVLFPDMFLSLGLCNVPSPSESHRASSIISEIMERWCFAEDIETFEHAGLEAVHLLCGPDCDNDLYDGLISYWAMKTHPEERKRIAEPVGVYLNRTPLTAEMLEQIKQPVLIFHGARNEMHGLEHAENLKEALTSVEGGAILVPITLGGSSNLSLDHNSASALNKVYAKFLLERVPRPESKVAFEDVAIKPRMQEALEKLATFMGRPEIAENDPMSPISFSCLSEEGIQRQTELLLRYAAGRNTSFSPLGPDGRPLRKFSDRIGRHWFEGGQDGLSATDPAFIASCSKHGIQARTSPSGNSENEKSSEKPHSNQMISTELLKSPLMRFAADPLCTLGRAAFS